MTRFESVCATATVAICHAALLVGSGVCVMVLTGGTERASAMGHHAQYESTLGLTFPGVSAMAANMAI